MEILDRLPDDLKWNVIKYLRHPLAERFLEEVEVDCRGDYLVFYSHIRNRFDDPLMEVKTKKIWIDRPEIFSNMPDDSDSDSDSD